MYHALALHGISTSPDCIIQRCELLSVPGPLPSLLPGPRICRDFSASVMVLSAKDRLAS